MRTMDYSQPQPHSVWLCPTPQVTSDLSREIEALTALTGTVPFVPHVTLLGDLGGPPKTTAEQCQNTLSEIGPLTARVTGLGRTENYFMSLFLDLTLSPCLEERRGALADALSISEPGGFRPHLSLAYGLEDGAMGGNQSDHLKTCYTDMEFRLTTVVIAASAREIPIEAWRILHSQPLEN